jgi:tetratricopeptide (TPR) repeat protein
MPARERKYDQYGFPVPGTFDDLPMPDRDSVGKAAAPTASRARGASRRKKIILGLVLLAVVALAAIPWLTDVGQGLLGDWLAQRARKRFNDGDMPGTVADSTRAFSLLGDELSDERRIELLAMRGCAKLRIHDLEGSRSDFDRVLTSPRSGRGVRLMCYFHRSWANCRLQNHAESVADATEAIQLLGRNDQLLPMFLNQRAYIRALANANREDASRDELQAGLDDIERAMQLTPLNPAFIDTRGYLRHLLGQHDDALLDMDQAIDLTERGLQRAYRFDEAEELKRDLAVMHYHRALIYDAQGKKVEAELEHHKAQEYGYNPAEGVL